MKMIGFVTPWYGDDATGGAETELKELVQHLHKAGIPLEVLTTCVRSFRHDWNDDYYRPGIVKEQDIPVRRFPVRKRDTSAFDQVNLKLIQGQQISQRDEEIFCREMINSPELYSYIRDHGEEYSWFVFIPYMFGTTYFGCQIHPEKSILIPCFHDESYAYLKCFREAFSKVSGMAFNAEPERLLAEKLYGVSGERFVTFGIGLDTNWTGNAERFRRKFRINDPFILYAGRKEAGKKVDVLVNWFTKYKKEKPDNLKLVLIGGGNIDIPDRENILDLGFVDKQDKYDAYAASNLFCNPSQMESFSLVIMESWLAGRPVLVNGECAVTRDFVHQSNGGLYYESYSEFAACIEYLSSHSEIASQMGKNGEQYVRDHFDWDVIVKRYQDYFSKEGKKNG